MGWCGRERVHVSAWGATAQRPFATKLPTGQYTLLFYTRAHQTTEYEEFFLTYS